MVSSPRSSEQLGRSNLPDLSQASHSLPLRRLVDVGALIRRRRGGESSLSDFYGMSSSPLWNRLRNFSWEDAGISVEEVKTVQRLSQDLAGKKKLEQ